jgi:DNA modification methylase
MTPVIVRNPVGDNPPESRLYYGKDVKETLRLLPDQSVHMIATSPPYWGHRDYGTEPVFWGGLNDCDHEWTDASDCTKCGAWKGHLGHEEAPEKYVAHMVELFQEARRVLRDDGILWLNLGDSYANNGCYINAQMQKEESKDLHNQHSNFPDRYKDHKSLRGGEYRIKSKDLVGIPWRVAFALQEDGWYLRRDIIWHKANPMPESVTDRCTSAHEYIFMLTKQPVYFYDAEAVAEEAGGISSGLRTYKYDGLKGHRTKQGFLAGADIQWETRNRRSVWTFPTESYSGAHFAVWPSKIVQLMILAGTSAKGCCQSCGAPWKRLVGRTELLKNTQAQTLGWEPTCECKDNDASGRSVVLDVFSGSGTTGKVANLLGKDYLGIDLNSEYLALAQARILGNEAPERKEERGLQESLLDFFGEDV